MRTRLLLLGAVAVAGIGSSANAQVSRVGNGYLLRVKYTQGQTIRFSVDSTVKGPKGSPIGNGMAFQMPMLLKVQRVANKVATVAITIGPMKGMKTGGPMPPARTVTYQINDRNQAVGGVAGNVGAQYPAKPIRVGETWTASVPMGMGPAQGMQMNSTYKLVGIKNVGGKQVAEVSLTISGPASGTGLMYLNVADGQLVSTTMNMSMNAGPQGPIGMKMVMKRY